MGKEFVPLSVRDAETDFFLFSAGEFPYALFVSLGEVKGSADLYDYE